MRNIIKCLSASAIALAMSCLAAFGQGADTSFVSGSRTAALNSRRGYTDGLPDFGVALQYVGIPHR